MLTKREFLSLYDETVTTLRQLKSNNDKLNKSIGVMNGAMLEREISVQENMINDICIKVEALISRMEKNYLDPDTARKIGVVKQQFRIQRDRRHQLVTNVMSQNQQAKKITTTQSLHTKQQYPTPQSPKKHPASSSTSTSVSTCSVSTTAGPSQMQMQMGDIDVQFQHQLLSDRNQQLSNTHKQLVCIQNVLMETEDLAYHQGDKLDIIGDDVFVAYKNVVMANEELSEANQIQKKARRKYIGVSLFLILVVAVVITILFVA